MKPLTLNLSGAIVLRQALQEWHTVVPDLIAQDPVAVARWRDERIMHGQDRTCLDNTLTDAIAPYALERPSEQTIIITLPLSAARQALLTAALLEWRRTPPAEIRSQAGHLRRWLEMRELYEDTLSALLSDMREPDGWEPTISRS